MHESQTGIEIMIKDSLLRDHPFKTSANFHKFLTPLPLTSAVFSTMGRQILQIFGPSPTLKTCRRLKWMVPNKCYDMSN